MELAVTLFLCGDLMLGRGIDQALAASVDPALHEAGDFLNDYEGIGGYEEYRPDLSLMYFPEVDASGQLRRLTMTPMQIRRFSLRRATGEDARWLAQLLQEESAPNGLSVETTEDGRLHVVW